MSVIIVIAALLLHLAMSAFMGTWIACSGVWKSEYFPLSEDDSWFAGAMWFLLPVSVVVFSIAFMVLKIHDFAAGLAKRRK